MSENLEAEHIRWVAHMSEEYVQNLRAQWPPDSLLGDWWVAMRFWFSHAFYRGRKDALSKRYEMAALAVLDRELSGGHDATRLARLDLASGGRLERSLAEGGLSNPADPRMVAGSLLLARELVESNLVQWAVGDIRSGAFDQVFIRLDEIPYVGDKITTFWLRDLDLLFDFGLDAADSILLQPIDTWVRQISARIGFVGEKVPEFWMKRSIVRNCLSVGAKPSLYNIGAYWVGKHGLVWPGGPNV